MPECIRPLLPTAPRMKSARWTPSATYSYLLFYSIALLDARTKERSARSKKTDGRHKLRVLARRFRHPFSRKKSGEKPLWLLSAVCRKSPPSVSFSEIYAVSLSPLRGSRAGNSARKPCCARPESAAHVAGFGLYLEGFSPPNLPEGFLTVCGHDWLIPLHPHLCGACA